MQKYYEEMVDSDIMALLSICAINQIELTAANLREYQNRAAIAIQTVSIKEGRGKRIPVGFSVHKEFDDNARIYHLGALPEHVDTVIDIVMGDLKSYCNQVRIIVPETNIFMAKALAKYGLTSKLVRSKTNGLDKIQFTWELAKAPKLNVSAAK